jgi:cytochrome c
MKRVLPFLLVLWIVACTAEKEAEHPLAVWVFRSVLDQKPRMVTAAIDSSLWVAYDTQTGLLYKAWQGGVLLDGAVYTMAHGPQPTSLGNPYFESEDQSWLLMSEGNSVAFDFQYKGHVIKGTNVIFNYEITSPEGDKIQISESPSFVKNESQNGLKRDFEIQNASSYQLALKTNLGILMNEQDYKTLAPFEIITSLEVGVADLKFQVVKGIFTLNNGHTEWEVYYHPAFDQLASSGTESSADDASVSGLAMIEKSDCSACHNEKLKTVGPAYLTIAKKYGDDQATVEMLAGKIINGGGGVWGVEMMTAHPDLIPNDAAQIVRYILRLDDKILTPFDKYAVGEKSVPLNLSEKYEGGAGKGFMAHLYLNSDHSEPLDVIEKSVPARQGPISKIHTLSEADLINFQEHIVVEYKGFLNIEQEGSYDFRLISDDGSFLFLDDQIVIDSGGDHGRQIRDGEMFLKAGLHPIKVLFGQGGGGAMISLQWFDKLAESFVLLDDKVVSFELSDVGETASYVPAGQLTKGIPGDALPLQAVHPAFKLAQARPDDFMPRVGGIDFLSDGRMVVCTWDSLGPVYIIENWESGIPDKMNVKRIAFGLAEPLGLKVVDDQIYVLQKQELTKLIDLDGDELIDEYQTVSNDWKVSGNFHEFAFGLVYQEGFFYATLATAITPGGASANPQISDRGKVIQIDKATGKVAFIASGLRTPNGIGVGKDNEIFVADNQGDWLPASKIIHIKEGAFYGSRSVDFEGTAGVQETLPVVWLPQDEIGNSPSTPISLDLGPYKGQMIHGEVTNGGIKRVFIEKVNGHYQGALFRFVQGLEAGVNRMTWAPNGSLVIGGVGSSGNWGHTGKFWYGLQSLTYNEQSAFEMLSVSAKSNGFEITFTEPIMEGQNISAEDFMIQQWRYEPTSEYGGPKLDLENLQVKSFHLSTDRKTVFMELPGIKENRVVYFRIIRPFASASGNELWTTESWYTLNQIPENLPGQTTDYKVAHNTLTDEELTNGWKLLFDGKSTTGLRNYNSTELGEKWNIQDESLHLVGVNAGGEWKYKSGGDVVVTDKVYKDYEFYIEWKIAPKGNSGVIYNVIEDPKFGAPWLTGPEMQILDNAGHPDGQFPKHLAGDLYDMIASKVISANGPNQWNRARLIVKDGHVEQWLNGFKSVSFDFWTEEWDQRVKNSKFKDMPAFGTGHEGHIVLQDHTDEVWFRNIKIRSL